MLIGARTAAWSGGGDIPLEYLHIGSGQWAFVDVGCVSASRFDSVEIEFRVTRLVAEYDFWFGGWNNVARSPQYSSATGAGMFVRRNSSSSIVNTGSYVRTNNLAQREIEKTVPSQSFVVSGFGNSASGWIHYDGVYKSDGSYSGMYNYSFPIVVGAMAWTQDIACSAWEVLGYDQGEMDVKRFKMFRNSDPTQMMHDLVPVIHGGEVCFYDAVTHSYVTNRGTGSFTPPT